MVKRILDRLRRLWRLAEEYDVDRAALRRGLSECHERIGEHTVIHADIHYRRAHQIIVVGRYRNRDYVRVFDVSVKDFEALVEHLRSIEPRSYIGRFDMPHAMSFSVVYPREKL